MTTQRARVALVLACVVAACTESGTSGSADSAVTDTTVSDTAITDGTITDSTTENETENETETENEVENEVENETETENETDAAETDAAETETDAAETDAAETETDAAGTDTDVDDRRCSPSLALTPEVAWTHARELVTFQVTGGTGDPRFELAQASLGATIHPTLGIYLAGSADAATDVVRVTDGGCDGEATALVHIVPPLVVSPRAATVAPSTGVVVITTSGGSGLTRFTLATNTSGATLDDAGAYHAGPTPGRDRVRVTDIETGAAAEVLIDVVSGAALSLVPPVIALPLGARWQLRARDGSGVFEVALDGDSVTHEGGWITAVAPGETTLALHDLHTDERTSARAIVVAPLAFDRHRGGDGTLTGVALAPGDIDGDGHPDAILGFTEADVGHLNAGALYVYRGVDGGLDPTPARVIGGDDRTDNLGRSAVVVDLDGDGALDLLVGSPLADPSGANVGLVRLYRGVPDAPGTFFEPTSSRTFVGDDPGDSFGTAIAVCDFNGDGRLDLAIGANTAEDNTQAGLSDSGGVVIWLGAPGGGFASAADQRLWGERPTPGGIWLPTSASRMGGTLAAGDFDGDGLCDLAAGSAELSTGAGRTNDGAVWLFRGRAPDALSFGGLEAHARMAWAGIDEDMPSSRFAASLAMGDLDGDDRADLVVGHYQQRVGALASHGVARVFFGGDLPEAATPPGFASPTTATWTWSGGGGNASDLIGFTVAIGDWDGAPPLDLLVTGLDDELAGGPSGAGVVYVLPGVDGAAPNPVAAATFAGDGGSQRFGTLAATLGDLDGDGRGEVIARAAFDATDGPRVGRHLLVYGDGVTPRVALEAPQAPAGSRIGQAVALVPDLDGDGHPELAVGAPLAQADPVVTTATARAGVVALHRGGPAGFAAAPSQRIESFTGLGTNDGLGDALAALGDFDGDGLPDLALLTARDSTGAACSPARNGVGAVHVFRGQADGSVAATPSFTYWGEQVNQRIERVAGADVDGDGRTDLIVGSTLWDGPDATAQPNVGAVAIVRGQSLGGALVHRCSADHVLLGPAANDALGSALAPLGDLDGDGCDDVAIGVRAEDVTGVTNPGGLRVLFGWGPTCLAGGGADAPRALAFVSFAAGATAGSSLAAGDLDGDGVADIAVGAPSFVQGGNATGAAWVLLGARVLDLVERATPWTDLVRPALDDVHRFAPADSSLDQRVEGRLAGELFGQAVAIVPPRGGPHGTLVVASPRSDLGGTLRAGVVLVYPWTAAGLATDPSLALGGETTWPLTELGASLVVVTPDDLGEPARLVVGAPASRLLGLDEGAVLELPLP